MKRKKTWFLCLGILTAMILIFSGHEPLNATLNLPAQAEGMPEMLAGRSGNQLLASPFLTPLPPLSDQPYKDPQGQFEVGILENYNVSAIDENPLIESADGTMAYTVVVQPKITNEQFSNEALAQIAMNQFQRGEGFQPETLQVLGNGEILIPWTGTVTVGRTSQPISGSIVVKQNPDRILILLVSATENASQDISAAIATLADSLKFL